jgi:nicotinate phosphoribosyltransferase
MSDKYHVSILDTDIYKFTMQNAICNLYPKIVNQYLFINRNNREFPEGFDIRLTEIVDSFRSFRLTKDEYNFLQDKCYYLNPVYLDFLSGYQYDPKEVKISQMGSNLEVTVIGPAYRTVLWEVPLMATISELYFEMTKQAPLNEEKCSEINKTKAKQLASINASYSEFGTRRRYSFKNQDKVISDLKKYGKGYMLGTSNVYLAMKHNLTPMGTVAHEWTQLHAALYGYKMANHMANEAWIKVYNGDLGTALPDTFTTEAFLKSFDTKNAKLFDGVRQDSGDPNAFTDKVIAHYKKLRINPQFKMILYSDNLNSIEKIKAIKDHLAISDNEWVFPFGRMLDRYGIGTWLSNDVGVLPLNIVIKLIGCKIEDEWVNTVKLSDDPMKNTGDPNEIAHCKKSLHL